MAESIITITDLVKNYGSGDHVTRATDGISLEIDEGEFLMITGRNGSGKSTLMHLMALLDDPDDGEVILFGNKTSKLGTREKSQLRLRELGYIFQEYALLPELTALENVMLPALMIGDTKSAKKKAEGLLKKVNLAEKSYRLPSQLSGGEQQRVAIARSLVNTPKIIFADEPTANLDTHAAKDVLEIFKKLNDEDGNTIVMVTHEPEEWVYATRRINLKNGKIHDEA